MNTTSILVIAALIAGLYYVTPILIAIIGGGLMTGIAQRYYLDGKARL